MKKIGLAILLILCAFASFAQNGLVVQSNDKGLYVTHTVASKENYYSIGRLYAISPKDIAAFNNADMSKGLEVGQAILIPLTAANFSQTSEKGTPVYYTVGEKEGLYRVSVKNNKVLMANLRKWNKLPNDNISTGQQLIVGYLQASGVPTVDVAANTTIPVPQETKPNVAKEEPRNEPPAETRTEPKPANNTATATPVANRPQVNTQGAGYFKTHFEQQVRSKPASKDATVTTGVFKTTSGWQDGKYYALIDGVEPGTIIKVVNPENNKAIYAKVLGEMSGIRQNQGLDVRISNAAAAALEITEQDKFVAKVQY